MTRAEMHKLFTVRSARAADAGELTRLARLSKAHWGYPKEWLDLWQNDLTISPETIEGAIGYVAESDASVIGFWIRASLDSDQPTPGWLFVHPDHMGQGVARALWESVRAEAAARGIKSFVIEADPNAVPFYLTLEAEKIGEKESSAIPGRFFPILRIAV
ncbi:N-acetyltransferase [Burkholderia sp. HI2761]|uniref:GNAT family N-acetyltransferase n=2 Tax=Burkholderiaceae TaxID=119060 RepID=UPI000555B6DD|nr:GNAT family N-acetyltransferase [Burkholderia sp. BE24]OXJ22440.1 N-acetyltransferase [Burkholderia sp. HI2761]